MSSAIPSSAVPIPSTFSAEAYFSTQLPPPGLEAEVNGVREFLHRQNAAGRKVVLVTSGGTTVPLELNVVRFLDNFSAGTRGATSAEYFLEAGYAVIFMHRQFSLQPFSRHYSHSTNPFLDFLEIETSTSTSSSTSDFDSPSPTDSNTQLPVFEPDEEVPRICVTASKRADLLRVLTAYRAVQKAGTLHTVTFVTVNEYLWLLRAISHELAFSGRRAMYYLAAAVSDFFLPTQKMSEHKIQSGKGSLVIEMDQVPKILKPMVDEWTPEGFIVSFKLETDPKLLVPKARQALERYGHQVVIGNDLHRRKFEVVFVSRPGDSGDIKESWLRLDEEEVKDGKEIEKDIISELVQRHLAWIGVTI
ncbi:phosphopantothenate-cysteine ligase [Rickenella mellea]|uniref:Phosphopantothenate-cysteine ligase n=1 Tax=Rickenella mellea TaxID=50990 RepID=A0A4Y7QC09_9AGAM|nr:phosphopantothenate-cysteine ligase [Rickenella mellea]